MRKFLLLILILFFSVTAFSQSLVIDSLKFLLKNAKHDTTRCKLLSIMVENEENDSIWAGYNEQVIKLSETNLKKINEQSSLYRFYLKSLAEALNNAGYLQKFKGDIPLAIDFYHRSLTLHEKLQNPQGVASTLNNLAFVYKNQGDFNKALEYFVKNLSLYTSINDKTGEAITLNNIGIIYNELKRYDEAISQYNECRIIIEKINNPKVLAYTLNNIGYAYLMKSRINSSKVIKSQLLLKAFDFFQKSLTIRETISDKRGKAISLENIAEVYTDQGRFDEAQKYGEQSLNLSYEIGYPDNIRRSSEILSKIYSFKGNWKSAFEMQVLFKQMSDSVTNESNRKLSIQKGFQHEYEKKTAADSVKVAEEKKVTAAQLKQEKTQRFALYGGLFLLGLFGVFMFNRFKVTKKQNDLIQIQKAELQVQKEIVEEHQKETLDSIHYAKRIQTALIANSDFITQNIPNNFIYFNPKDIVSGDFYWATKHNDKFYLAVCDSTGHGVPGAFMSLLNMGFLSEAIKEKNIEKPNEIFNYVRERLISSISDGGQKDGMDGILICIDTNLSSLQGVRAESRTITYAAANNEPILIRNNEIIELAKDKMPVGKGEKTEMFSLQTIELKPGDALYLYTDGFADQFGGPKGKKFKYRQLNDLLLKIKDTPLAHQKQELELAFTNWKGNQEQVDDILIIGIKI